MPYKRSSAASDVKRRAARLAHHPGYAVVRRASARQLSAWHTHSAVDRELTIANTREQ